jgi:hypothetical protein
MGHWAIYGGRDDDGERLYWSNQDGWVDSSSADLFSVEEMEVVRLPLDGSWVPMDWEP